MRVVTVPTSEGGQELNEIKHLKCLERQWHIVVRSQLEVFFLFYCLVSASNMEAGHLPGDQRPVLTCKKREVEVLL